MLRLERQNTAVCICDLEAFESPGAITADFVFVRPHGPASAYAGGLR